MLCLLLDLSFDHPVDGSAGLVLIYPVSHEVKHEKQETRPEEESPPCEGDATCLHDADNYAAYEHYSQEEPGQAVDAHTVEEITGIHLLHH